MFVAWDRNEADAQEDELIFGLTNCSLDMITRKLIIRDAAATRVSMGKAREPEPSIIQH